MNRKTGTQERDLVLCRAFSQLSPPAFSHPIWVHHAQAGWPFSSVDITKIDRTAAQLLADRLFHDSCQCWLICAALSKNIGDVSSAMDFVQTAENTAERLDQRPVVYWTDWARAALSFQKHDLQEVVLRLKELQQHLNDGDEWLLANTIEVTWRALLQPDEDPRGRQVVSDWLRLWGMPPVIIAAPYRRQVEPKSRLRSFLLRFYRYLKSLRLKISAWLDPPPDISPIEREALEPLKPFNNENGRNISKELLITGASDLTTGEVSPQQPSSGMRGDNRPVPIPQPPPVIGRPATRLSNPAARHSLAETPFVIYTFGSFQAYWKGELIENWSSRKALSVFKYLLNEYDHPVVKEILMEAFWPDADVESARRNLHQAIYSLRQTLRAHDPELAFIQFNNDTYFIHPDIEIWMDFREFDRYVVTGRRLAEVDAAQKAALAYESAVVLYQDDFMLDDPYDEWLQAPRRYYRQTFLLTADWLAYHYYGQGEFLMSIHISRRILSFENTYENAHLILMRCYLEMGQRQMALLQYRSCVEALERELNMAPSEKLEHLYRKILDS